MNSKIRQLEDELYAVLNNYRADVPIEAMRLIVKGILTQITCMADNQIALELQPEKPIVEEGEMKDAEST